MNKNNYDSKIRAIKNLWIGRREDLFIRILWVMFFKLFVNSFIPGTAWRKFILRIFGAKIGKGGKFKPNIKITFPWRLVIGDYCWIGENVWIDNLALVSIGNRVCISQKVYICTGNHDFRTETFPLSLGPVYIKDNVWIALYQYLLILLRK